MPIRILQNALFIIVILQKVPRKKNEVISNDTPKITSFLSKSPDKFTPFSGKGFVLGGNPGDKYNKTTLFKTTSTKKKPTNEISNGTLDISLYFKKSDDDILSFSNNILKSTPKKNKLKHKSPDSILDISTCFKKSEDNTSTPIGSVCKSQNKKVSSKHPINSNDISTYFKKSEDSVSSFSDSISDTELSILTPPRKRQKSNDAVSNSTSKERLCPICNRSGFEDFHSHVDRCISLQRKSPTPNSPNMKNGSMAKSNTTYQVCSICNKSILDNVNDHIRICIASIPCESDDDSIWEVETGNISSDIISLDPQHVLTSSQNVTVSPRPSSSNHVVLSPKPTVISRKSSVIFMDEDVVKCPVCHVVTELDVINAHLDICLGMSN